MSKKQVKSLENLLRTTETVGKGKDKKEVSCEFAVDVDTERAGVHLSIGVIGDDNSLLDFTVVGNKVVPWFVNADASGMTFGEATGCMIRGDRVAREGWNGNGMFMEAQIPNEHSKMTTPYFYMVIPECEEGTRMIPYTPTMIDVIAGDWLVVTESTPQAPKTATEIAGEENGKGTGKQED